MSPEQVAAQTAQSEARIAEAAELELKALRKFKSSIAEAIAALDAILEKSRGES